MNETLRENRKNHMKVKEVFERGGLRKAQENEGWMHRRT